MPCRRLIPALAVVLGGQACALASAEERPRALTFAQALGLASEAPRVAGTREAASVKREADKAIPRVVYNPQIVVQPGYRLLTENAREPEVIVEVAQPINLGGLSAARRATAADEEKVLDAQALAVALEQRLLAGRAWIDLWTVQEVWKAVQREQQIAAELERLVERAAAVSAATRADLADAKSFHAEARLQALAAEGDVHDLGLLLAREVGIDVRGPLSATGELPEVPLPPRPRWDVLVERTSRLPAVQVAALRQRAERAREIEERAARSSVLQLGANLQRDAPGGLVVSALVRAIPAWADRGQRERAVLQAETARLEGLARDARVAGAIELLAAIHEFEHTAEISRELSEHLVPAAREAAGARSLIYQAGEATLPDVLQARRVELAAVSRQQRALGAHAWARVKLWLLLGAIEGEAAPPVAAAPPPPTAPPAPPPSPPAPSSAPPVSPAPGSRP